MKPFQLLIKPVSFDCNLKCQYCFYLRVEDEYPLVKHPRMSDQVLETMVSKYLQYRFPESIFGFQGGEPTLAGLEFFKKLISYQQQYGEPGQVVGNALQTNGVLINHDWAKFLHTYRFLVGLSLDGPKNVHDRYRRTIGGKSVWDKIMNAAEIFKQNDVKFNILCVVSKANVNRVKEVYNFFLKHDFHYMQFIPALEVDEEGKRAPFSINAKQYGKFLCSLFDIWKKNPRNASIRYFDSILAHLLGYPKGSCVFEKKCGDYLLIEHNGDVYPCDFFVKQKWKLGNLMEDDFSSLKQKRDNTFGQLKLNLAKSCQKCKWMDFCYGGCIKDRQFLDNPHPDRSYFCESYRMLFNHSIHWFKEQAEQMHR
ncbi:MAG: anaerobic sulfatase maturase [Candidatus Lokiarchaeota archaeon]|nr:anaerobic sulfatase maturase [Candidatus Lokiarchaeota archaeon]MBD3199316.1 anaerobic sulfatase maturase [Candidatus Lokiarchaeota archaeon]